MRQLLSILAFIITLTSLGANCADSVNVYFSVGHRTFDPALGHNREVMAAFVDKVRDAVEAGDLESIVVYGYASPEGKPRANERLARSRCSTIAEYLTANAGVSPSMVEQRPSGIGWGELRRLVADNAGVPCREKVLDILDNTPLYVYDVQGRTIDGLKKQLMDLAGGRAWRWMYAHLFPKLRNAVAISLYRRTPQADAAVETVTVDTVEIEETVVDTGEEYCADTSSADTSSVDATAEDTANAEMAEAADLADDAPYYRLALKTNMLYYAALLPNVEMEWLIDHRWSVALEGCVAAWGSYKRNKSYRLNIIDAEVRRWINPRAPWHGMYAGVIAGGGWYDLLKNTPGRYGWGMMSGVSVGYSWPIKHRLSLEAEVGLGYVFTRYKEYQPVDGHHVYMRTKDVNYFGPIKLKFSIAWRFCDVNKPKRRAKSVI